MFFISLNEIYIYTISLLAWWLASLLTYLEQDRKNLTMQLNNSESNIAVYLKGNDDIEVIQKTLRECTELEEKLIVELLNL